MSKANWLKEEKRQTCAGSLIVKHPRSSYANDDAIELLPITTIITLPNMQGLYTGTGFFGSST